MQRVGSRRLFLVAGLVLAALAAGGCRPARWVLPVYLTWSDEDTSTTMTVSYHTRGSFAGTHVYYDTQPRHGDLARYAGHARGFERSIPGVDRSVHVTPLTGLTPATRYWFVAGDPTSGFSAERSFRTLPDDGSAITFVAGGDMSTGLYPRLTSWQAARTQPSFALLGGDLAYCNGAPERYKRWQSWFADWEATMQTSEGELIPIVAAIGNHDRSSEHEGYDAEKVAPFFHGFLYQDPAARSYFVRKLGKRATLFVLDTGHLADHAGPQRDWLEVELGKRSELPVKLALYHVALYPAVQKEAHSVLAGREHWLPLFDAFRLTAAFENHGHLHKRTFPLRGGVPVGDGGGTVYFGDGLWGKENPRLPASNRPFVATAFPRRHFWKVTLSEQGARYEAIDGLGRVFDHAAQDASGRWLSE